MELGEEPALDTWEVERSVKQRTNQKAISQPIAQTECNIWNNIDRIGVQGLEVPNWSRFGPVPGRELTVIDVGNGLKVEVHPSVHSRQREHDRGVAYEAPLDIPPSAMDWAEQRDHAFEEQHGEHP